jgi:hypothetical protein
MSLDESWLAQFCSPEISRSEALRDTLVELGYSPCPIQTGPWNHWQSKNGLPSEGELVLVAHYDRQPGTPGANDNSASVFHLLNYLARSSGRASHRVVFTDGEEVFGDRQVSLQGARLLGDFWKSVHRIPRVLVLDMCGIGDTFVLGHLSEHLKASIGLAEDPATKALRLWTRRLLAGTDAGDFIEIDTPFSDDLGFLWSGIPAVQISLLPRKQALKYQKERKNNPMESSLPEAWRTMHTSQDLPQDLWPQSKVLLQKLLDRIDQVPYRPG